MKKQRTYSLEKATKKDLPAIIEMQGLLADYLHSLDGYYLDGKKGNNPGFIKFLKASIRKDNALWLMAKVDGESIGYFGAMIQERYSTSAKKVGYIIDAFLYPPYRHQGIATAAFKEFKNWFKSKRIKIMELTVTSKNSLSLKAWKSFGFEPFLQKLKLKI